MSHIVQDWEPLVLRKEKPTQSVQHKEGFKKVQKLVSDEAEPPKTLGLTAGKQIFQARNALKLSQENLAQRINVKATTIRDYESGAVVPNRQVLNLLNKVLKIKIVM